jgi:hypothetical protein
MIKLNKNIILKNKIKKIGTKKLMKWWRWEKQNKKKHKIIKKKDKKLLLYDKKNIKNNLLSIQY